MVLTGKALEDFYKYASYNYGEDSGDLNMMREAMRNALIIDWFDTVGIVINIGGVIRNGIYNFSFEIQENNTLNSIENYVLNTRQEATKQAIIKANEIYNEQQQEK